MNEAMSEVVLRFRDLKGSGQTLIIAIAVLTFGVAAVAFADSYDAVYAWVHWMGLYSLGANRVFPLLCDATFVVAELASILGRMMYAMTNSREVHRGWPVVTMLGVGGLTVGFNVLHAILTAYQVQAVPGINPQVLVYSRAATAALPPLLMMAAFQINYAIVKWTMVMLGKPLSHPLLDYELSRMDDGPSSGSVQRLDDVRRKAVSTVRRAIEQHLAQRSPDELHDPQVTTGGKVHEELLARGLEVSKPYVERVLGRYRATHPKKSSA
jgi:hypothetical protein